MKYFLLLSVFFSTFVLADIIPLPQVMMIKPDKSGLSPAISGGQHHLVLKKLKTMSAISFSTTPNFIILIKHPTDHAPAFKDQEGYSLESDGKELRLVSETEYGALHGLETLRQIMLDHHGKVPELKITDYPRFPWRGLLIDVARSWISIETLKKQIDLMAALKLNVLHLHLSDDQSFRLESKLFPKLHVNNPDRHFYTQKELQQLVIYASEQGIRVVPEFDVPGHVTAMVAAYPELATKKEITSPSPNFGPHDASLNPIKEESYIFLEKLFAEMTSLFPDDFFHVGGDEVTGKHWGSDKAISEYMKEKKIKDLVELQFVFTKRIESIVNKLNKKMIAWDEVLKEGGQLDSVIQVWRGQHFAKEALAKKLPVIYSYGYYLDLQLSSGTHYEIDPAKDLGLNSDPDLLWGGEACLWSERVTDETITNRIWPRAMAIAERLWSNQKVRDVRDFYDRQIGLARNFEIYEIKILERILRETKTLGVSQETLGEFFSWLEPGKFYSQHRSRKWTTQTVQDQWVDILPSESLKAVMLNWVYVDWMKKRDATNFKLLDDTFSSWTKLSEALVPLQEKKFSEKDDLTALARDLGGLSRVAKDALKYLHTDEVPSRLWWMENRTRLGMFGQLRGGMQPAMHTLVEMMVQQVAQKHQLSLR